LRTCGKAWSASPRIPWLPARAHPVDLLLDVLTSSTSIRCLREWRTAVRLPALFMLPNMAANKVHAHRACFCYQEVS
jgi:hypothetical protein